MSVCNLFSKRGQSLLMINLLFAAIGTVLLITLLMGVRAGSEIPGVDLPELEMRFEEVAEAPREASADVNSFLRLTIDEPVKSEKSMRDAIRNYLIYENKEDDYEEIIEERLETHFPERKVKLEMKDRTIENDVEIPQDREISTQVSRIVALPEGLVEEMSFEITREDPENGEGDE